MYHSISSVPEAAVHPYYRLNTSPARFEQQMRWLYESGYITIDLTEASRRAANGDLTGRIVVITFDDGYLDFLTQGWPVLQRYGFTATVFLPTAFIGVNRRQFRDLDCLVWSEVRELARYGVSFGSHSVSHPVMHRTAGASVRQELRHSKAHIENELGLQIADFAYPYAFPSGNAQFVWTLRHELVEAGYQHCATTSVGWYSNNADPLAIHRLPINNADDHELFAAKLSGAYNWVGAVQGVSRSLKTMGGGLTDPLGSS